MKRTAITSMTGVVLLLFYFLSYAPIFRLQHGTDKGLLDGRMYWADPDGKTGVYSPVCWAIDYTPAREPLLVWARWWDVAVMQEVASSIRKGKYEFNRSVPEITYTVK